MGYSTLCDNHKRRNRRHGHPEQRSVTSYELEPFRKRVKARIEKNASNPTWKLLRDRWEALEGIAKGHVEQYGTGVPYNLHQREAWANVATLGAAAQTMDIIEIVLAMYLMQEENPYRFKSDEAFSGQLVRRVRNLAPTSIATYQDFRTNKAKRVYRDLKPRTVEILARMLQETFGVAGLTVAKLEQQEAAQKQNEQRSLHNALSELV
ncbi:hypothetical protein ABC383_02140 [Noviherbaspirillum sp. 1P10PC]|uniref:hypothetical protein n=1 Tax=Noviherbaspirillum sp. 1P10PC TaxID=3132292 RepID=UPI0039A0D77D